MIYEKDLCTYEEFKNMSIRERRYYLNKVYGDSLSHRVIAVIKEFSSNKIEFEIKYFILQNNLLQEFYLFKDKSFSSFTSNSNNLIASCIKKNFSVGDSLVCEIYAGDVHPVSFFVCSKKQAKSILETYEKIGISYNPDEISKENNKNFNDDSTLANIDVQLQKNIEEKNSEIELLEKSLNELKKLQEDAENQYKDKVQIQEQRLTEEYNQKKSELQNLISGMENERNELKEDIEDLNSNIEDLNKKIQRLNNELEEKSNERYELEEYIENLNRQKDSLEEKLNILRAYGINFFEEEPAEEIVVEEETADFEGAIDFLFNGDSAKKISTQKKSVKLRNFNDFDKMADYWQSHLNTAKYNFLKYDKRILESLYFGLQTDQLILLMGNPGTGKTSLVKALAKSFNFADAKIIPVQSNWTDKSDLLGYYNPLEKNYVATPFLDALINFSRQAEKNPDKLFIICLDEMNLAHVEYYFAEFLSVLQDSDNAEITLYSEQLQQNILYELENVGFKIDGDKIFYEGTPLERLRLLERKYYFELRRLAQMLINYPAKFKIPKNVKFFGTLNQDETTLDISPKVLDRSYVIRVEKFSDAEKIPVGDETPLQYQPLEDFENKLELIYNIESIKNILKNFKAVHISRRVIDKILDNDKFLNYLENIGYYSTIDYLVASCVLPKVRLDETNYDKYAAEIAKLCFGTLSEEIWQRINSPEEKIADFWRR